MSVLKFFDSAKALAFGKTVAEEFCKVHALVDSNKKHAGRKPERMIVLIRKTSAFARTEQLNFYVRAKMLAEIKDGLKSAGVAQAEIDEFVRAIALEELRARRQA